VDPCNGSDLIEVLRMANNLSPYPIDQTLTIEPVVIYLNWSNIVATTKSVVTSSQKELLIVGTCWIKTQSAKSVNGFKLQLESERKRKMGLFLN